MNPSQPQKLTPVLKCFLNADLTREECLALHELVSDAARRRVIKATPKRTTYTVEIDFGKGNLPLFVKALTPATTWDRVKGLFRPALGLKAWRAAVTCSQKGIPTACPVAFMVDATDRTSYLISEFLQGWERIDFFFRDRAERGGPGSEDKRSLLHAVAQALRKFHDAGVFQPDAIAGNIMVHREGDEWGAAFVDLDACTFPDNVSTEQRIKALGRLDASLKPYVTRTDRLRFLRTYAEDNAELTSSKTVQAILEIARKR